MENPGPTKPQRSGTQTSTTTLLTPSDKTVLEDMISPTSETLNLLATSPTSPTTPSTLLPPTPAPTPTTPNGTSVGLTPAVRNCKATTPPHRLLLETSFTCSPGASPEPRPDLRSRGRAPALPWELLSALEEQLLFGPKDPQDYSEWPGLAPLASPEVLSEASSIVSRHSLLLRDHPKIMPSIPTIHHSPAAPRARQQTHLGKGYCFFVDSSLNGSNGTFVVSTPPSSSSEADDIPSPRSSSPSSFITIEPIIPSSTPPTREITPTINKNSKETVINGVDYREQVRNKQKLECNKNTSDISPESGDSRISSSTLDKGNNPLTESQLSKDSGYGEKCDVKETPPSDWGNASIDFLGGWEIPQQEY